MYRTKVWAQWDAQELARMEAVKRGHWIDLNNLYLAIERGDVKLTITSANTLRVLVGQAYDRTDTVMQGYWQSEFEKLPGWWEV